MRTAINAVIIEKKKLLLVRKNLFWILPGGKPEYGESDLVCLLREIKEELSDTRLKDIRYYNRFEGYTPHKGDKLNAKVYFASINGKLNNVREGDSIAESRWVQDFSNYNLSDITSKIVKSLRREYYL